ncbi:MAG: hypothetical protein ABJI96_00475 [Paracoccaceae bacterium]
MSRYFDAHAVLAEMEGNPIHPIQPIPEKVTAKNSTNRVNRVPPDVEIFEERAAIAEYDGGLSRADAEQLAAQCQGFENVVAFKVAQRKSTDP